MRIQAILRPPQGCSLATCSASQISSSTSDATKSSVGTRRSRLRRPNFRCCADDAVRARADHGDLVAGLDVDEHATRDGVVLHVAGLAAERHGADAKTAEPNTISAPLTHRTRRCGSRRSRTRSRPGTRPQEHARRPCSSARRSSRVGDRRSPTRTRGGATAPRGRRALRVPGSSSRPGASLRRRRSRRRRRGARCRAVPRGVDACVVEARAPAQEGTLATVFSDNDAAPRASALAARNLAVPGPRRSACPNDPLRNRSRLHRPPGTK